MAFETHLLNEAGIRKAQVIGLAFQSLLTELGDYCENGRDFAIAKTKLEEACFWAKRAMATNPENRQDSGPKPVPADRRSKPELPGDHSAGD